MDTNTTPHLREMDLMIHADPLERAERLLSAAGFTFTVVDTCPASSCEVCKPRSALAAA